jgi:hypothetical protein
MGQARTPPLCRVVAESAIEKTVKPDMSASVQSRPARRSGFAIDPSRLLRSLTGLGVSGGHSSVWRVFALYPPVPAAPEWG